MNEWMNKSEKGKNGENKKKRNIQNMSTVAIINRVGKSHMWYGYKIESVICSSWNGTCMTNPGLHCTYDMSGQNTLSPNKL